ncbi:MAG: alpha/beta hydrolase family protein [Lachnospiraceae bacterium]
MLEKKLSILHHNRTISGTAYLPAEHGCYPLLIISHGFNGTENDFKELAFIAVEHGMAAITYDFCGGSVHSKSTLATTEMTIFTEIEDLFAVLDEAKKWEIVDKNNIFLFGESQGGLVTALAAEERKKEFRAITLLYPAFCIPDYWRCRFPKREDIPDVENLWGMNLGRIFFETIHDYDVFQHIGTFDKKVLILHGDADLIVPLNYSERAQKCYPQAKLTVFSGQRHGFTPIESRRMKEMTVQFFDSEKV